MKLSAGPGWLEVKRPLRTTRIELATVNDVHLRRDKVALGDRSGRTVEIPLASLLADPQVCKAVHEGLRAARVAGSVHGDDVNLVLAKTSCT